MGIINQLITGGAPPCRFPCSQKHAGLGLPCFQTLSNGGNMTETWDWSTELWNNTDELSQESPIPGFFGFELQDTLPVLIRTCGHCKM